MFIFREWTTDFHYFSCYHTCWKLTHRKFQLLRPIWVRALIFWSWNSCPQNGPNVLWGSCRPSGQRWKFDQISSLANHKNVFIDLYLHQSIRNQIPDTLSAAELSMIAPSELWDTRFEIFWILGNWLDNMFTTGSNKYRVTKKGFSRSEAPRSENFKIMYLRAQTEL